MLVRLFGGNFRSFKDPFELSLVAADLKRKEDRNRGVVKVPIDGLDEPLSLLKCVAIYGANASGKSTVLWAASALRWLGTESSPGSAPGAPIPLYIPFSLEAGSRTAPIELGCDVVYKRSILRYAIRYDGTSFHAESLSTLSGDRETVLIERKPSGEVSGEVVKASAANRLYVEEMQPNIAVLSKLAQHGPAKGKGSVLPYYQAIRNATRFADYSMSAGIWFAGSGADLERFAEDAEYREWVMRHLIRPADLGIHDVRARIDRVQHPASLVEFAKAEGTIKLLEKQVNVVFLHEGETSPSIEIFLESSGTRKLLTIAGDWWSLANEPGALFADELSASLHPRLLDRLIRSINDASATPTRSQLVFATHETGLLESQDGQPPALRRDQVYFTKKDAQGASELYSLAEFKEEARPMHNIRRRYLSGLYGAIPSVQRLSL